MPRRPSFLGTMDWFVLYWFPNVDVSHSSCRNEWWRSGDHAKKCRYCIHRGFSNQITTTTTAAAAAAAADGLVVMCRPEQHNRRGLLIVSLEFTNINANASRNKKNRTSEIEDQCYAQTRTYITVSRIRELLCTLTRLVFYQCRS